MAASNESNIWAFLKSKGVSDSAAAGIMGNLDAESGFRPGAQNGIGAFGIAQWLGGRKSALQSYAAGRGEAASSLDAQLNYLWKEVKSGSYGSIETMNNQDPGQAALYFMNSFEKPGDNSGGTRVSDALSVYQKYTGKVGSYTPDASSQASGSSAGSSSETSYSNNNDFISQVNDSMQIGSFSLTNPFKYGGAIALRGVFVLIGILCVAFGLFAAVEKMAK